MVSTLTVSLGDMAELYLVCYTYKYLASGTVP